MACACGSRKSRQTKYEWTGPNGERKTKNSRVEVEYLTTRRGGTWRSVVS